MSRNYRPTLVTGPETAPVTLAEARAHCRVDSDVDDPLLSALILAAVSHLDGWSGVLGRCLISQTWRQTFDAFGVLGLPFPTETVTAISYVDPAGSVQMLAPTAYVLRHVPGGSCVEPAPGSAWPLADSGAEGVAVTFVAGYGPAASDVPAAIRQAILLLVGHWYENREGAVLGTVATELPLAVSALIGSYRVVGL